MRALLLAAGYGTRLYPLTRDRAKPLLPVGGRPLLDRLAEDVAAVEQVEEIVVVTNRRFADAISRWARGTSPGVPVRVVDDGTSRPSERLGAVGDMAFAVQAAGLSGDLLVTAGDNLYRFDLQDFVDAFGSRPGAEAMAAVERAEDPDELRRRGVAEVAEDGRIVRLVEKPDDPSSDLAVAPLYVLGRSVTDLLPEYIDAGREADAPGHFLEWLVPRRRVHAWRFEEGRFDIGTPGAYRRARRAFSGQSRPGGRETSGPNPNAAEEDG